MKGFFKKIKGKQDGNSTGPNPGLFVEETLQRTALSWSGDAGDLRGVEDAATGELKGGHDGVMFLAGCRSPSDANSEHTRKHPTRYRKCLLVGMNLERKTILCGKI